MLAACYHEGTWEWGGCDGANSISDAQQLLCLLYPATEIGAFALDSPDDMAADVSSALESLGPPLQIGAVTVGVLEDYLTRYTGPEGEPVFAAGGHLRSADDRALIDAQLGQLDRARQLLDTRPATAFSLASAALIGLDELAYARRDAERG